MIYANPLCGQKQGFRSVTLEDLYWCRIFLSEVLAVPLSFLCPSSGKPIKKSEHMFIILKIYDDDSTSPKQSSSGSVSTYSVCIVVEDNKVAVADIKAWEVVACILGIKNVFIDHVSSSSCFRSVSSKGQKHKTELLATLHQRHTWHHSFRQIRKLMLGTLLLTFWSDE